jgi:hypothetical protein
MLNGARCRGRGALAVNGIVAQVQTGCDQQHEGENEREVLHVIS